MKRIYRLWVMRQLAHSMLLKLVFIGALMLELRNLVFVKQITGSVLNMPTTSAMLSYLQYAFMHTQASVQITFALLAALAVWLVVDAAKKDFFVPARTLTV